VVSERDIIQKVALMDTQVFDEIKVNEIFTPNPITVSANMCVNDCMALMLEHDFRHLPILTKDKVILGMISVKDCLKMVVDQQEETIQVLSNFAMGKSGTFVVD